MDIESKADAWFVGSDGMLPVMKMFLILRSKVFKTMLSGNPDSDVAKEGKIELKDFDLRTLSAFWKYVVGDIKKGWDDDFELTKNLLDLGLKSEDRILSGGVS